MGQSGPRGTMVLLGSISKLYDFFVPEVVFVTAWAFNSLKHINVAAGRPTVCLFRLAAEEADRRSE